jgi:hypothetical protein
MTEPSGQIPAAVSVCPACGAPLGVPAPRPRAWYRTFPAIAAFSVTAAVAMASIVVAILMASSGAPGAGMSSKHEELTQWWSATYPHVAELQDTLDDSEHALERVDGPALASACQRMHDAAGVDIAARLPSPDADLTAELAAAIEDAHAASHMCLSVLDTTPNNYDAEFASGVDQADRHLEAALAIVNRNLTRESRWSSRH